MSSGVFALGDREDRRRRRPARRGTAGRARRASCARSGSRVAAGTLAAFAVIDRLVQAADRSCVAFAGSPVDEVDARREHLVEVGR